MDEATVSGLRTILELGWPAIVLVMLVFMWRSYQQLLERYIADLREINGLKSTLAITQAEDGTKTPGVTRWRRSSRPSG